MRKLKESVFLIIIFLGLIFLLIINYLKEDDMEYINVNIVPTNISEIKDNSVWCPTLQLIWNDLKNQVIGDEIEFINDQSNQDVLDLNKESFKEEMIDSNYFYKTYGYMTPLLKEEIETNIWNKFKEKSEILDKYNFREDNSEYFFYSMLVRNFTFNYPFDILSNDTFGINQNSSNKLDENVRVLFYDEDSYAVKLLTTDGDEVILYHGKRGFSFDDTYEMIIKNQRESLFMESDTISISNMNFKGESNYETLTGKEFYDINGVVHKIDEVVQMITFNLDNTGGKVKSEAGIGVRTSIIQENRHFDFTNNFVLFLKQDNKDKPYFAINVVDIEKFSSK